MVKRLLCGLCCFLLLISCSKNTEEDDALEMYKGMSDQKLYQNALSAIKETDYSSAIKRFEAFETLFPFSVNAQKSELYLIYAYFKNSDYALSAAAAERYIHLHPREKHVDYAYYMKGVANFEQERGTFAKAFKLDDSWRDPGTQLTSYHDFSVWLNAFLKAVIILILLSEWFIYEINLLKKNYILPIFI